MLYFVMILYYVLLLLYHVCSVVFGEDGIDATVVNEHLEQFADQGFHYGRDWLKVQVLNNH